MVSMKPKVYQVVEEDTFPVARKTFVRGRS
jgi:hypothetical protein